jgi:hypothetical protein
MLVLGVLLDSDFHNWSMFRLISPRWPICYPLSGDLILLMEFCLSVAFCSGSFSGLWGLWKS